MNGLLQLPNLLLLDLRLQMGLQAPFVPNQRFPTEDCSAQPTTGDWTAASTAQATEQVGMTTEWSQLVLPQTFKQKMEID